MMLKVTAVALLLASVVVLGRADILRLSLGDKAMLDSGMSCRPTLAATQLSPLESTCSNEHRYPPTITKQASQCK